MSVHLTTQLLTFAKGGKPAIKTVALRPLIHNAVRFALCGSACHSVLDLPTDLWPVDADEGQIGQVLQNIVMNANEAMPQGGPIRIMAENRELEPGRSLYLAGGGRFVCISIRDGGTGIPGQYLGKIFDPYFTTKKRGSGLGLATSYSIVRNHGGMIDVQSEPGFGSTFFIYLPASSGKEGAEAVTELPQSSPAQAERKKILVMDDEEMVRETAVEMLESCGHEVVAVADGENALREFGDARTKGQPFDRVILDLTIKGGMGGEETIRKMRDMEPAVVAIVSSGYSDSPVMADYRAYGFSAVLGKPYRLEKLKECLAGLEQET